MDISFQKDEGVGWLTAYDHKDTIVSDNSWTFSYLKLMHTQACWLPILLLFMLRIVRNIFAEYFSMLVTQPRTTIYKKNKNVIS